ncbi:MAG TPA: hypothetical protein VN324_06225, partial [Quisquiliibacterium sp.]|nr:hypothetical protein [Quisquiliibacterium sp.]
MMRAWCVAPETAPDAAPRADVPPLGQAWARFEAALPRLAGAYRKWSGQLAATEDLATRLVEYCRDRL